MESAGSNVVDFCAAVSDAQMAETNGIPMNGTYSSCRATQTDVIDTDDNCTNQQPLSAFADGAAEEMPTNDSLDASLDVNDASVSTNTNETTSAMDTNDPKTTTQNRWVKPQPLTLDKTTSSEDILLNALPSLNINSSSSMVSPSSILSDSTVDDIKSPTSSSELIDFHPDHHHHHFHNNNNHEAQAMAQNLASEHRIFLRAALDMLTERDQLRMYADVNDPNNIIKTGTLRKASHRIKGVWRTKHVEIREGVFSYLSGSANKSSSSRKDVLLRASSCTCRAVKIRSVKIRPSNFGNGFVFELKIQGGSRRLWMANTREERLSWMQAIHSAMIGASVTRSDNFLEYHIDNNNNSSSGKKKGNKLPVNSPYQAYLEQYIEVGEACTRAETKAEYLSALASLRGKSITVPVQWIKSQLDDTPAASAFLENDISSCVEQLWKDLVRDSVEINGHVLTGESFHGPERIVGKLTQQILVSDKSQNSEDANRITESQSVLYARNILLGADRTRTGGDSYYCAENLCTNRNLVVICPSSTEANPLSITVHASSGDEESSQRDNRPADSPTELSSSVATRSSSDAPWKKMHLVFSESNVHFHDESDKCQLLQKISLIGAKVTASTSCTDSDSQTIGRVLTVVTGEEGLAQEFLFEDEFDFFLWRSSFEKAAVICGSNGKHVPDKALLASNTKQSDDASTVDVSVNVSTDYKMCTLDPQGIESEDTWGTIRTTFKQQFRLSGGPSGRIFRGDEVVQLDLL
ncbi:hypothetical protein QTG54_005774 [Skeletonema marinoi]|uniref:PH domain-containing protein n=1 Tax=Skeletonema marinoi TaxID=267567 RepID=A0AAD8YBG0_9STRA|nr:hypothetical protein QTG54_005774 [Skeletonema marinoi]